MLSRPEYLAQDRSPILASLSINREFGEHKMQKMVRPQGWVVRSFSPEITGGTFPNKMHAVWMMREMIRWGHLHPDADILKIADCCCDAGAYRAAALSLNITCPADGNDFLPMDLRSGRLLRKEDVHLPSKRLPGRDDNESPDLEMMTAGHSPAVA